MENGIKSVILLLFITGTQIVFDQTIKTEQLKKPCNLNLSYNGGVFYPGIKTGIEFPIRHTLKSKDKRSGKIKIIQKEQYSTINLSWYHHKNFHDNLYATAGYLFRRTNPKGLFLEFVPELGYSRTFLGGTTYQVSDQGAIKVKEAAGYNYALISLGFGIGFDFSINNTKPIAVYSKLDLINMFPYNNTSLIRPMIEFGIRITPSNFLTVNIKNITK